MLGDYGHIIALTPDLKLLYCSSTESVTRRQHDALAARLKLLRKLANRRRFPHTIDSDHQNHVRLFATVDHQWLLRHREHVLKLFDQSLVQCV